MFDEKYNRRVILEPDAKIGDPPIVAIDTGFKYDGKRIFLEGDDATRFVQDVMRYYPMLRHW